ncbi:MAG: class I SAM-dependent methyltransferase [Theionarchaea archaeon]|nr:class I SAM-dependent methyltransferase [Theionarchaea archaeon]
MHDRRSEIIAGWNTLSPFYQKETQISTFDIHYGPLSHGEKRLNLLGPVKGKKILEIGCGGGQNTIALTRWGAHGVGIDPSESQILYARDLAQKCNVDATYHLGTAEDLSQFAPEEFHAVLSSFALDYIFDIDRAFEEIHRVLKKNGIFVFCFSHPFFNAVGFYLAGDPEDPEINDYLSWPDVISWTWIFSTGEVQMWSYVRSLSHMCNTLIDHGFTIKNLVEQGIEDVNRMSEEEKAELPYLCSLEKREYDVMRKIPYTLIIKAQKVS